MVRCVNYLIILFATVHDSTFLCSYVHNWGSLTNSVVDIDTVSLFKAHLDKFWYHQDVSSLLRPHWSQQ